MKLDIETLLGELEALAQRKRYEYVLEKDASDAVSRINALATELLNAFKKATIEELDDR